MFDRLVFGKLKSRLGGRVQLLVSGGAPLAADVEEFLRVTMCTKVVQVGHRQAQQAARFLRPSTAVTTPHVQDPFTNA